MRVTRDTTRVAAKFLDCLGCICVEFWWRRVWPDPVLQGKSVHVHKPIVTRYCYCKVVPLLSPVVYRHSRMCHSGRVKLRGSLLSV